MFLYSSCRPALVIVKYGIIVVDHENITCLLRDSGTDRESARHFLVPRKTPHRSACTGLYSPILVCLWPPPPPAYPAADGIVSCPPGLDWRVVSS